MKTNDDLIDRNILAPFDETFRAMGISKYQILTAIQDFSLPSLDFDTREKLSTDGLLVAGNFADEWIELAEPQLYFKYKKRVVIMYQRDQLLTQENYAQRRYRPYHLCFCKALREAHEKNRYEGRYVMTYNTSGKFKVNLSVRDKNSDGTVYTLKKEQDIFLPLRVCQHCLREINWKHFRSYCGGGLEWWRGGNSYMRNKIVDEFNLEEYLVTARQDNFFDHPVFGTASSTISNEYVLSPEIKEALKKIVDYTCDICREQFPANELQIHHKNHLPGDNRRQNLMVVCENCHALIHDAEGGFVSSKKNRSTSAVTVAKRTFSSAEYAAAQKNLGDMYANGWGVPKDESKAQIFYGKSFKAYQNLAAEEDVDAWYELANFFYTLGAGVEYNPWKNIQEAQRRFKNIFTCYKAKADSGDIKAKIRLGLMYAKGLGVQQDLYSAKEIIASVRKDVKIVDSEFIELCILAGSINDALKFHAKAVQLWEIAAKNGDKDAPLELAKLYSYKNLIGSEFED